MSQIDITQLLEPQGPFDVIVHKLSDVMVEAERDSRSQQLLANFQVVGEGGVPCCSEIRNPPPETFLRSVPWCPPPSRATWRPTRRRCSWTPCPP